MQGGNVTLSVDEFLEHLKGERIDEEFVVKRFDELNTQLFRNGLPRPTFATCMHDGRFAWFVPAPLRIIMFHPRVLEQEPRWISGWCISSSTRSTATVISSTRSGS